MADQIESVINVAEWNEKIERLLTQLNKLLDIESNIKAIGKEMGVDIIIKIEHKCPKQEQ